MEKSLLWIVFVPQYASESRARKGKMDCFTTLAMTIAHENRGERKSGEAAFPLPNERVMSSWRAKRSNLSQNLFY